MAGRTKRRGAILVAPRPAAALRGSRTGRKAMLVAPSTPFTTRGSPMNISTPRLLLAPLLLLVAAASFAADTWSTPDNSDKLGAARARIAEKNWAAAIDELKKVGDTGNADWNNLMGYSLRKIGRAHV